MKKYVITRFKAGNIAKLSNVNFETDSSDVLITGKNGAGKSTIKKALAWILTGSTVEGEKLIPYGSNKMPFAEIEIYDGVGYVTFRKEMIENRDIEGKISRTVRCYIQNVTSAQKDFQEYFNQIAPAEIFKLMINLFGFTSLKPAEQRALLMKYFGNVTDETVIESDETLKGMNFGTFTPEKFIESTKKEILRLKKSAERIALEIEILQKEVGTVAVEILKVYKSALDTVKKFVKEHTNERENALRLNLRAKEAGMVIENLKNKVNRLREQWVNVRKTCPACGQNLPPEKVKETRDKIAAEAIECKKTVEAELEAEKSVKRQSSEVQSILAKINRMLKVQSWLENKVARLEYKNDGQTRKLQRIETLREKAKSVGVELTNSERKIALAERFILRKTELVTEAINSKFKRVKFKMFEKSKSGEILNTCEATLNGVPFAYLSKGEQFTAALDILNAFQKRFDAALPLIIDDAESYSEGTMADYDILPNQKILLKVTGEKLKIEGGKSA